jgi:hypothetical protein
VFVKRRWSTVRKFFAAAVLVLLAAPGRACAQDSTSGGTGRLLDFSVLQGKEDKAGTSGILGEAVPPAVILLDPTMPPGVNGSVPFGYSAMGVPRTHLTNEHGDFSVFRQDASIGAPLVSNGTRTVIGYLDFRSLNIDTDAFLKDSRQPFPDHLYDLTAGLTYNRKMEEGWTLGGGMSIGSPSDRPYSSLRVIAPTFSVYGRVPYGQDNDAWMASLSWAPVSAVRFPLPGLAYEWNPSERLQIVAGLPFSMTWKPTDSVRFDMGYIPPYQSRAQLTWHAFQYVDFFTGFESYTDSYLLAHRQNRRQIFYAYEDRALGGVRFDLGKHFVLDAAGGYLFGRLFFSSSSITDESHDRIHVAPGAFGMLRFAVVF